MAQKKRIRYRMDQTGRSIQAAMSLMGLSFFLRVVYYFGCVRIETVGFWELLSWLILPMLLEGAFIVLLRILKWDTPRLYALMAAVFGVVLIFQSFGYGSVLRTVFSILAYLACTVLALGVAEGYLSKQIAATAFLVTALARLLIFELVPYVFHLRIIAFIRDVSGLVVLLALMCLMNAFAEKTKKK